MITELERRGLDGSWDGLSPKFQEKLIDAYISGLHNHMVRWYLSRCVAEFKQEFEYNIPGDALVRLADGWMDNDNLEGRRFLLLARKHVVEWDLPMPRFEDFRLARSNVGLSGNVEKGLKPLFKVAGGIYFWPHPDASICGMERCGKFRREDLNGYLMPKTIRFRGKKNEKFNQFMRKLLYYMEMSDVISSHLSDYQMVDCIQQCLDEEAGDWFQEQLLDRGGLKFSKAILVLIEQYSEDAESFLEDNGEGLSRIENRLMEVAAMNNLSNNIPMAVQSGNDDSEMRDCGNELSDVASEDYNVSNNDSRYVAFHSAPEGECCGTGDAYLSVKDEVRTEEECVVKMDCPGCG